MAASLKAHQVSTTNRQLYTLGQTKAEHHLPHKGREGDRFTGIAVKEVRKPCQG